MSAVAKEVNDQLDTARMQGDAAKSQGDTTKKANENRGRDVVSGWVSVQKAGEGSPVTNDSPVTNSVPGTPLDTPPLSPRLSAATQLNREPLVAAMKAAQDDDHIRKVNDEWQRKMADMQLKLNAAEAKAAADATKAAADVAKAAAETKAAAEKTNADSDSLLGVDLGNKKEKDETESQYIVRQQQEAETDQIERDKTLKNIMELKEGPWLLIPKTIPDDKEKREENYIRYITFVRKNPAIEWLLGYYICRNSPQQFFRAYPELWSQGLPYFIASGIAGGVVGAGLGYYCICNPNLLLKNSRSATGVKAYWIIRDGLLIFIGMMSVSIAIELALHPEESVPGSTVKPEIFGVHIILPSSLTASTLAIWNMLTLKYKQEKCHRYLQKTLNFSSKFIFNYCMWELFSKQVWQLPLNTAEITSLGFTGATWFIEKILRQPYKKLPYTAVLFFTGITGLYGIISELFLNPLQKELVDDYTSYHWLAYLAGLLTCLDLLGSCYFMARRWKQFKETYDTYYGSYEDEIQLDNPEPPILHPLLDDVSTSRGTTGSISMVATPLALSAPAALGSEFSAMVDGDVTRCSPTVTAGATAAAAAPRHHEEKRRGGPVPALVYSSAASSAATARLLTAGRSDDHDQQAAAAARLLATAPLNPHNRFTPAAAATTV